MKHVVVIGAGLAGLATAIRLAHAGFRVTVLEKNKRVGGKMNIVQCKGYTFDSGPSLLTMPFIVEELFTSVGRRFEDYLQLVRVEPLCRYHWPDGARLDASTHPDRMRTEMAALNPSDADAFPRFMDHGKRLYDAAAEAFLYQPLWSLALRDLLHKLHLVPRVVHLDPFRTYSMAVSSFFRDPRLQQLFNRYATYNGSTPYRAPATLLIIPYIELTYGGWYIAGGMYGLADALLRLAQSFGVVVQTDAPVVRIAVERKVARAVVVASGEEVRADVVVSNADVAYTYHSLLGYTGRRFASYEPSLSGFVVMLGVRQRFPSLLHHNIFFSSDYRAEFDALVERQTIPTDPTVYVTNTSFTDPHHAPDGCSNLFVLVNAPPLGTAPSAQRHGWLRWGGVYRTIILEKLARMGLRIEEQDIEVEEIITPADFESWYNAWRGTLYGMSSNTRRSAFLRHANTAPRIRNLYFAGGTVHPGGGIPLALLSGKHAADMILRREAT